MHHHIAIVALSDSFATIWEAIGQKLGATVSVVPDRRPPDKNVSVVLIAAGGSEEAAVSVVARLSQQVAPVPTAVAGAIADHRVALALMRAGADDYFALPGDLGALEKWLAGKLQSSERLRNATNTRRTHDYSRIIGRSAALQEVLDLTSRVIPHHTANVLITGETGTGKELIAHAIHYNGARAHAPFVDVNCAALPANLVESELFGFEPGAFTDAKVSKPGLIESAHRGTLFLDEVGDLPLDLQAKLLRTLDAGRVRRLGTTQATAVDVRIIAATNIDLADAVQCRQFREDLYYRLNTFRIHLPALRDRGDDVVLLAEHFSAEFCARHGVRYRPLDESSIKMLREHSWPGNIRELRNAMERAVLLGDSRLALASASQRQSRSAVGTLPFPADMEAIQQAAALGMVERYRGNKSAAANALGISRKRLYALLNAPARHGVQMPQHDRRTSLFVQEELSPSSPATPLHCMLWITLADSKHAGPQ